MTAIDIFIQNYFASIRTPGLTEAMYFVSKIFDLSFYFVALTLAFATLIYLARGYKYSVLLISSLIIGGVLTYILKILFNVSRPGDYVSVSYGQSFPSYHAAIATIFFVILMYIFDDYFPRTPRILFNSLCSMIILFVAFSRIYLGAHWFSDVISGIILGGVVSYLGILFFSKWQNK